jgi:hypothetical protein
MSGSFAGSRSLDERRRRRLASEADDAAVPSPVQPASSRGSSKTNGGTEPRRDSAEFPLRKLVSRRLWKHWSLVLIGLAVGASILAAGYCATAFAHKLGPGFVHQFNLESARFIRGYTSMMFLLAGQFALLIFWIRSRSLRDFAGSYRLWAWVAAAWMLTSLCVATEAHTAITETVFWLQTIDVWNGRVLSWLAPVAVIGLGYLWALTREMYGCRSSLTMLWLAALLSAASGALLLGFELPFEEFTQPGSAMAGALCLAASMMLHSRYVIYESAEPREIQRPAKVSIATTTKRRFGLPRLRLPSFGSKTAAVKSGEPSGAAAKKPSAQKPKSQSPVKPSSSPTPEAKKAASPVDAKKPAPQSNQAEPDFDDTEYDEPERSGGKKLRVDQPIDRNLLKGLSKRERRMVRKQHRDQQRATREDEE